MNQSPDACKMQTSGLFSIWLQLFDGFCCVLRLRVQEKGIGESAKNTESRRKPLASAAFLLHALRLLFSQSILHGIPQMDEGQTFIVA